MASVQGSNPWSFANLQLQLASYVEAIAFVSLLAALVLLTRLRHPDPPSSAQGAAWSAGQLRQRTSRQADD